MKRFLFRVLGLAARVAVVAVVAVVAMFGVRSSAAQAPSLGEVAKKEAERRKAQPPSGKVYTNKDLPPSAQNRTPAPAPPPAETTIPLDPVAAAAAQKPEEPKKEEKDEAWWKARMNQVREELRRNEMFAEALQTRINALSRDFVNRDNPVQRAKISQDRGEALTELARVKQEIERAKKQIEDIEEEARKAGVPPGWLR
jgi:hypothetical protein